MIFTIATLSVLLAFFIVVSVRITMKYMVSEFKIGYYENILKQRDIDISDMESMTFKRMVKFMSGDKGGEG